MTMEETKRNIGMVFKGEITKIFGDVVFAFICGSVSDDTFTENSDIDLFICTKSEINKQTINKYDLWHEHIHNMFQMKMDKIYRGEIMTINELDEKIALAGKEFPQISLKRPDIYDAIVWCGMIVGKKSFFVGNIDEFKNREEIALKVVEKWKIAIVKELINMRSDLFLKKFIEYDERV